MTINRRNIEAYLLDYLEGNLDPLLTADLMVFLSDNPEFEKYLPDYDHLLLSAEDNKFKNKEALKKDFADVPEINPDNFDEFCIAYCEGLLNEAASNRLTGYIAGDPEKQKVLDVYGSLRLQPDRSIRYNGKAKLKKAVPGNFRMQYLYYGISIAASIALLVLIVFPKHKNSSVDTVALVSKPSVTESQVSTAKQYVTVPEVTGIRVPEQRKIHKSVPVANKTLTARNNDYHTTPETEREEIKPLKPIVRNSIQPVHNTFPLNLPRMSLAKEEELPLASGNTRDKTLVDNPASDNLINSLIAKVDLWKTAETAIHGFNQLTESELSLSRTIDHNGNLTGVLLNTEVYSITRNKRR